MHKTCYLLSIGVQEFRVQRSSRMFIDVRYVTVQGQCVILSSMYIRLQYIQQLGLRGLLLSPELSGAVVMSSHRLEAVLAGAYRVFTGA